MDSSFPERVTIETTSYCNLDCAMCYTKTCPKGAMTDDLFTKVVNECEGSNVETIVPFFRGEPFCDQKFIKRMRYIKAKVPWARIELASNGTLLNKENILNLCELNIDFFSISVDTGDRNLTQDQKERVDKAIDLVLLYKKDDMFFQVSTVDAGQKTQNLNEFVHKWKDRVDQVKIFTQHTVAGKYGKTKEKRDGRAYCRKLGTDMVIYFDGTIGLCCYDWDRKDNEIGNANSNTMTEIWQNAKYNSIRRQHKEMKITDRVCRNCDMWR